MYVGEVPQLEACYSQGETIDELMANIREVIEMCPKTLTEPRQRRKLDSASISQAKIVSPNLKITATP